MKEVKTQITPSEQLIELLNKSKTPENLKEKVREFKEIYKQIENIGSNFIEKYRLLHEKFSLDPGQIQLYLVGGRVKAKPLNKGTDIDLVICVEFPRKSAGNLHDGPWDVETAGYIQLSLKREIKKALNEVCKSKGLTNHFHILEYGKSLPEKINTEKAILIPK